ncbi:restriction endonuclease [Agrobacterium sp. NPDC090283]|uniref:restriction endonuclease n=1 Tax=Agrobacterium sp. NPDC090283 TaxID=3363920 RepID=UPI00383A6F6A
MADRPDDLERLIHETLEELGWDADASLVAERVRRLDIGLPVEDEFAVLCSWLGKCDLIHKLDQHQMPKASRQRYQVPDMLAHFSTQKDERPVLIEIKSKKAQTLSFRPDYFEKLKNYADMIGSSLLIAWKFHSMWMVFEARHMKKAKANFNISYDLAIKENLLGVLAGDVVYKIGARAGIHIKLKKEELVEVEESDREKTETWNVRFSELVYTNGSGEPITGLSSDVVSLLTTWDLETSEDHQADHIWVRHTASGDGIEFAHRALVRLLDWQKAGQEKTSWRREARKEKLNTIEDFRAAVLNALNLKVVQYVLNIQPHSHPEFLPERKSTAT